MKKLKVIGVKSVFIVSVVLGSVIGLLVGFGFLVFDLIDHQYLLGAVTFVAAPILYGLLFSVGNALMAWIYNRIAERLGGIEITLED